MIRACIVDDEEKSRNVLRTLLHKFHPEIELCGEASSCDQAYSLLLSQQPDLVFLDVQMPHGSGFDLLRKFSAIPFHVIFVTGYDAYAIHAIKFNALDYLLKPVEVLELNAAVNKAKALLETSIPQNEHYLNLLNDFIGEPSSRSILVHQHDKVILQRISRIMYIEADDRYCKIHTDEHKTMLVTRTLKEMETYLEPVSQFIRISRTVILNVAHVASYAKGEPCFVQLVNGPQFEISRRRKQLFLDYIRNRSDSSQ